MNKYYVWNDKIKVWVQANHPVEAIAAALSYCGFKDSIDIPDHLISSSNFTVDCMGFRHIEGSFVPLIDTELIVDGPNEINELMFPMHLVDKDRALEFFDDLQHRYDPFCQDEYYRELGENDD